MSDEELKYTRSNMREAFDWGATHGLTLRNPVGVMNRDTRFAELMKKHYNDPVEPLFVCRYWTETEGPFTVHARAENSKEVAKYFLESLIKNEVVFRTLEITLLEGQ